MIRDEREARFWRTMSDEAWVERALPGTDEIHIWIGTSLRKNGRPPRLQIKWRNGSLFGATSVFDAVETTENGRSVFLYHIRLGNLAAAADSASLLSIFADAILLDGGSKSVSVTLPDFVPTPRVVFGDRAIAVRRTGSGTLSFRNDRRTGFANAEPRPGVKRIMVFTNQIFFGGGKTKAVLQLAQELARGGHEVCVTSLWFANKPPKFKFPDNVAFDFIDGTYRAKATDPEAGTSAFAGINKSITMMTDARLAAYLSKNYFDLIYIPNFDSFIYKIFVDNVHRNTVLILGDHNPRRPEMVARDKPNDDFVWASRAFDAVHTVNPLIAELVQLLTSKDVFAIPNMSEYKYAPRDAQFFKTRRLVSIGRLVGTKRMNHVIDAFALIAERFPAWTLDIFGQGEKVDDLQALIGKHGLARRVTLRGFDPGVGKFLSDGAVFVSGSAAEAHPLVLIEAMAAGCPVICYDRQYGAKYMVTHEETGFLAPDADKPAFAGTMARVMEMVEAKDQRLLDLLDRAGASVAAFDREKIAGEWLAKVDELCRVKLKG